jgi:hypothetical protein
MTLTSRLHTAQGSHDCLPTPRVRATSETPSEHCECRTADDLVAKSARESSHWQGLPRRVIARMPMDWLLDSEIPVHCA